MRVHADLAITPHLQRSGAGQMTVAPLQISQHERILSYTRADMEDSPLCVLQQAAR